MRDDVLIKIDNLTKNFKLLHKRQRSFKDYLFYKFTESESFNIISNLSIKVSRGEFLGIIGPNGVGKSTLLKLIAGVFQPDSGSVYTKGRISPFIELGAGMQPALSGRDNIFLYGAILGLTRIEIKERYDSVVRFAELERFIDQKVKKYSVGMQVRLAFSITAHLDSDIILIDEVLAVGDKDFQNKCMNKMSEFKKCGKTVVFVSHNLNEVKKNAHRVLVLSKNKKNFITTDFTNLDSYLNK